MAADIFTIPPTAQAVPRTHLHRFVDPAEIGAVHDQPADPALISPVHLPALAHVAADLDGIDAPGKIVNPLALARCSDCAHGDDIPELGAIATVVGYAPDGFGYRTPTCALHLAGVIRHYRHHGWTTVVEVPTCSRQWFRRDDRETYWALDSEHGVTVCRDWDYAWTVREVARGVDVVLAVVPIRGDFDGSRRRAEVLGQAYAAVRAADAYEAGFSDDVTVALPVVAVNEVAA